MRNAVPVVRFYAAPINPWANGSTPAIQIVKIGSTRSLGSGWRF